MNIDAVSPRQREIRFGHTKREALATPNNCLEVQWRFLQPKNLKPPQYCSSSRKPILIDPLMTQAQSSHDKNVYASTSPNNRPTASRGSPSRLFHMFEMQALEPDQTNAPSFDTTQHESSLPESSRTSRTLNDLMGETQRQAMLDRILADMEYLAVEPTYSRLGHEESPSTTSPRGAQRARSRKSSVLQTILRSELSSPRVKGQKKQRKFTALWALDDQGAQSDDDDDDDDDDSFDNGQPGNDMERGGHDAKMVKDRKRRQRRKLQQYNEEDQAPLIFWQQTTGVRSAADVPVGLLTLSPSPPRRQGSTKIIMPRRFHSSRRILSPSNDERQGSKRDSISQIDQQLIPQAAAKSPRSTVSPRRRRRHIPSTSLERSSKDSAPVSPKAHYGAWYIPQAEWWSLHQAEQQSIIDKFPGSIPPHKNDVDEPPHCHTGDRSPLQRQHKPPLPVAALSPRSIEDSLPPSSKLGLHKPRSPRHSTVSNTSSRMPSASSRQGTTAASGGPLELQVASIPQSYIGREYRAFILSTGSAMPQYLQ